MEIAVMRNNSDYKHVIERWIDNVTSDGGIDRFDDLHIDTLNPSYSDRSKWIPGGMASFLAAQEYADKYSDTVTLALAFSLESSVVPEGKSAISSTGLGDKLDWSPPSLYLFWRHREPWEETDYKISVITTPVDPKAVFGDFIDGIRLKCCSYLMEFKQEGNNEYYRTVYLTRARQRKTPDL